VSGCAGVQVLGKPEFTEENMGSVNEIAAGIAHLPVSIANVYFVGSPGQPWVLVDTGVPGKVDAIREAAESRYGPAARPQAIILTHGHFDHAGNASELADCGRFRFTRTAWSCPI
jgi:glyoxylase-like metal-dependent hydrolase (beta-lactamase superfamily II)